LIIFATISLIYYITNRIPVEIVLKINYVGWDPILIIFDSHGKDVQSGKESVRQLK
jgi:hypothetical protein